MAANLQHIASSHFTAQNFTEYPNLQGENEESTIDSPTSPLQANLLFHVVIVSDDVDRWLLFVPKDWVDMLSQYILNPHPTFNVCEKYPQEWGELSFNRRRFPTTQFVEYPIEDVISSTPGGMDEAKKLIEEVLEASLPQEEENEDEIDSNYQKPGYFCESPSLLSPEVSKARQLKTIGEVNDYIYSSRRSNSLLQEQQQFTPYNRSSNDRSREGSEHRKSVSSSLSRA